MELQERIKGGLWGVIVGDALGFPLQFKDRQRVKEEIPSPEKVQMVSGLWSDDSSLTLATADALANYGPSLEKIAENFVRWFYEGAYTPTGYAFDEGRTTTIAIENLRAGLDPLSSGLKGDWDNGNGSLMRILPATYWAYFKITDLREKLNFIHQVSAITHAHPRSMLGCGIYSFFIWNILDGLPKKEAYEKTLKEVQDFYSSDERFKKELKHYRRILSGEILQLEEEDIKTSGYVVHTLEAALWGFMKFNSFEGILKRLVYLGDDADTVGAVAGSIAGTYYGLKSIPHNWLEKIERREFVEEIINRFLTIAPSPNR